MPASKITGFTDRRYGITERPASVIPYLLSVKPRIDIRSLIIAPISVTIEIANFNILDQ